MKLVTVKMLFLAFIGCVLLSSCGESDGKAGNEDSTFVEKVEAATDGVTDAFDGNPEQRFVIDAVELNERELAWLSAGQHNGTDGVLKKEAKSMLADHRKIGTSIKNYASARSLEVPVVDTKDEVNINEDRGKEWDRKWAEKVVRYHEQAISNLEKAQNKVDDAELKAIIDKALPKLQIHLEAVRQLEERLK